MEPDKVIKISPSSLNLYLDCPRCFWLQMNKGIKRPKTPTSSLPNGIDLTLKVYFDHWRGKGGMPPLLKDNLPGRLLADRALISKFRSRTFQIFDNEVKAYFGGILDDALELNDGSIVPLDNKTRGFPPIEPHSSHIIQMSSYTWLLKESGFKTQNLAYLIYWFFNHKNFDLEKPLYFNVSVEELNTNPELIQKTFRQAVLSLKEPIPPASLECQFCQYRRGAKRSLADARDESVE